MNTPQTVAHLTLSTLKRSKEFSDRGNWEAMTSWPEWLQDDVARIHAKGSKEHVALFKAVSNAVVMWEDYSGDFEAIEPFGSAAFLLSTAVANAVEAEQNDWGDSVEVGLEAFNLMQVMGYDWQQDGGAVHWAIFGAKATTAEILTFCLPRALRHLGLAEAA